MSANGSVGVVYIILYNDFSLDVAEESCPDGQHQVAFWSIYGVTPPFNI
jgi:hypothetical protein